MKHQYVSNFLYCSIGEVIGSDQVGNFYKGKFKYRYCVTDVMVKTLKKESDSKEKIMFLQEAVILNQLEHPNVIALCGVLRDEELVSTDLLQGNFCIHFFTFRICKFWI